MRIKIQLFKTRKAGYNSVPSRIASPQNPAVGGKQITMAHHTISRIDRYSDARPASNGDGAAGAPLSDCSALTSVAEPVNPDLEQIVKEARLASNATGAAIVLARGGERICPARSGATAGDVVVYLNAHSAILHACLRTGEIQRCDDAEADSRFDAAVCRRFGLRSLLIVRVQTKNNVRGVIEIFSPRPRDFCDRDVLMLEKLVHRVAAVNIDPSETLKTPALVPDVDARPVSPPRVSRRPSLLGSRPQLKLRIPAAPSIHWTLLVTLIGLPLLMGWMLGAAAAGPAQGPTQVKSAIMVPPASLVAPPSVAPSRDPLPAEKTSQDADAATNRSDASALPVLSSPVLILEDVANALLLRRVDPEYPSEARDRRIQGTVVMKVIVGKDGSVERVSRIAGDSQLALATATAMRQWRFNPLLRNGLATGFESHITLDFALP
jgi:TonB family protein